MFHSIVVVSDLSDEGDRALPVAGVLARRADIPVEIVTVSSPGIPDGHDTEDLRRALRTLDGVRARPVALQSNAPISTVREFLDDRPHALVVMSTHARGPVAELLLGSVSEALLVQEPRPALLVGPHVRVDPPPAMTTLVACVDGSEESEAIVPAVVAWEQSFGGDTPWFVEVVPSSTELSERLQQADALEGGHIRQLAERAHKFAVEAQWEVAHGDDPGDAILEFAGQFENPILALASRRWTDPEHLHLHSTAREIARRSTVPVLVVHPASQRAVSSGRGTNAFESGNLGS